MRIHQLEQPADTMSVILKQTGRQRVRGGGKKSRQCEETPWRWLTTVRGAAPTVRSIITNVVDIWVGWHQLQPGCSDHMCESAALTSPGPTDKVALPTKTPRRQQSESEERERHPARGGGRPPQSSSRRRRDPCAQINCGVEGASPVCLASI